MSGEEPERWLAHGANASEWERLREALSLTRGFALFLVLVSDRWGEATWTRVLHAEAARLDRPVLRASAAGVGDQSAVRVFMATAASDRALLVLETVDASETNIEALERSFAQLNGRRDQIVARAGGPMIVLLRVDTLRRMADVAPDLLSVHAAQFRLVSPPRSKRAPPWLLLAHESAGALGLDPSFGPSDVSGLPRLIEEPPRLPRELIGRTEQLAQIEEWIRSGQRLIQIGGQRGAGRSTLAAALIERTAGSWDRVLWVAGRIAGSAHMILHAIVAGLAEVGERPPVEAHDLEARYLELTSRRRVLIVVDDLDGAISLSIPRQGSCLLFIRASLEPGAVDLVVAPFRDTEVDPRGPSLVAEPIPETTWALSRASPDGSDPRGAARWFDALAARLEGEPRQSISEFERRVLYYQAWTCSEGGRKEDDVEDEWRGLWANEALVEATLDSCPPPRRAPFLDWLRGREFSAFVFALRAFSPQLRRRVEELEAAVDPAAYTLALLLTRLRPPFDMPSPEKRALRAWEEVGAGALSRAAHVELRRLFGLDDAHEGDAASDDAAVTLVRAFGTLDPLEDEHGDAVERRLGDASVHPWPRDREAFAHLAWAGLTWLRIQRRAPREASEALAQAEATARAWATPFALLRARLLRFEHALVFGDPTRASEHFTALFARCEQLFGEVHGVTLHVLIRGVRALVEIGELARARELARDCWRRLELVGLERVSEDAISELERDSTRCGVERAAARPLASRVGFERDSTRGTGPPASRAVFVRAPDLERRGSGYVIVAGDEVLAFTAAHNVSGTDVCGVGVMEAKIFFPAKVIWRDENADVAVLRLVSPPDVDFGPEPRWAALRDADGECQAVGFPMFMGGESELFVGRLRPGSGSKREGLELMHALPHPPQSWKGFSGAGVFADGFLVGIVTKATHDRLRAWPVARLLEDDAFIAAVGVTHQRLEPHALWPEADRGALERLEPWHTPHRPSIRRPAQLLRASFGVVPFDARLRSRELEQLERFVSAEGPGLTIVTGAGGSGKTRLLLEFCARMRERGWLAGFVNLRRDDLGRVARGQTRRVLVIDYAESAVEQVQKIVDDMVRPSRPTTRLVLLARRRGPWVDRLLQHDVAASLLAASPGFELGDLDAMQSQATHDAAYRAFGGEGEPAWTPGVAQPLIHHMSALLAVLDQEASSEGPAAVLGRVLGHERSFWVGRLAPRLRREADRVGAALVLVGGFERAQLPGLVGRVVPEGSSADIAELSSCFGELYAREARVAALEPDLLGEQLVLETLSWDEDNLGPEALARWLELAFEVDVPGAIGRTMTVLTRLAARDEERARLWLTQLLREHGAMLITEISSGVRSDPAGVTLADAIIVAGDLAVALALEQAMPSRTVALREVGSAIEQVIVDARRRDERDDPDARGPLAMSLNNLGSRLRGLGRREDALAATQEAVELYRELAEVRPDAFLANLAASLNNLGAMLRDLGRREEALAAMQEAVAIRRELAKVRPDAFLPDLAMSLNNLGIRLSDLGRREEALAAMQEAVELYRELARGRPDAFLPDLAMSLNNLGIRLRDLGRREDALAATQGAVELYRELTEARPDAFLPDLAMSLNNLGAMLRDLGRREDALAATQEAVELYRELAEARPDAFLPDLAMSLSNLGAMLRGLGRREDTLAATQKAVELYRELARARPDAFLPDLATSLNNLGIRLADLGRREEALAATQEAVEYYKELAEGRPEAFLPNLATSLGVHAMVLFEAGQPGPAADFFAQGLRAALSLHATQPGAVAHLIEPLARDYRRACTKSSKEPADDLRSILARFEAPPE